MASANHALPRPALTRLQGKVLRRLGSFIRAHGYAPTYRELMACCGLVNVRAITWHLEALQRKGYITREPMVSRSIKVVA